MSILGDDPILGGLRDDPIAGKPRAILSADGHFDQEIFIWAGGWDTGNQLHRIDSEGNQVWSIDAGNTVYAIAVDPDGFSYIGNRSDEIRKIDPDGNLVWNYEHGDQAHRNAIAIDPGGFVYIGDDNDRVTKLDGNLDPSDPSFVVWSFEAVNEVRGVDVDADGFVYAGTEQSSGFANPNDSTVHKIDPDGVEVTEDNWPHLHSDSEDITNLAVSPDGEVAFSSDEIEVVQLNADGSVRWTFDSPEEDILCVTTDQHGNVYAGEDASSGDVSRVYKIDPDGNEVWTFEEHLNTVDGVTVDPNGNVYSASQDNTVRKISSTGEEIWSYQEHDESLNAVAVTPGRVGSFSDEWPG